MTTDSVVKLAEETVQKVREYCRRALEPMTARINEIDARVRATNDSTASILDDLDRRIAELEARK